MGEKLFSENQSRDLMAGFLQDLQKHCKERFTPEGIEEFENFLFIPFGDPGFPEDWEESYERTFGMPFSDDTLLTEEEAFTAMIEFCALHIYQWGFGISEVLNLLFLVRYKPDETQKERALWKEGVD